MTRLNIVSPDMNSRQTARPRRHLNSAGGLIVVAAATVIAIAWAIMKGPDEVQAQEPAVKASPTAKTTAAAAANRKNSGAHIQAQKLESGDESAADAQFTNGNAVADKEHWPKADFYNGAVYVEWTTSYRGGDVVTVEIRAPGSYRIKVTGGGEKLDSQRMVDVPENGTRKIVICRRTAGLKAYVTVTIAFDDKTETHILGP